MLGPQKVMNINARTGSSAATVRLASSARRDESAGDGEDAVALAPRHRQPTRLITSLRLMATLHAQAQLLLLLVRDRQRGGRAWRMEAIETRRREALYIQSER